MREAKEIALSFVLFVGMFVLMGAYFGQGFLVSILWGVGFFLGWAAIEAAERLRG